MHTHTHGNGLSFADLGILITGPAGIGKSLLSLQLLERGFYFVSDDLCQIERPPKAPIIELSAPDNTQAILHSPGVGFIDIAEHFGDLIIQQKVPLRLEIALCENLNTPNNLHPWQTTSHFGVEIPKVFLDTSTRFVWPSMVEILVKKVACHKDLILAEEAVASSTNRKDTT